MRMRRAHLLLSVCLAAAACGDNLAAEAADPPDAGEDPLVVRGRYLVNDVSQCPFCHTPRRSDGMPDATRWLGGVDCLYDVVPDDDQAGCLSSRNLTDHPTGLANASDDEIKAAILDGVGTDGRNLIGLMPYWVFHNMTGEDADAIVAYLRTLTPVQHMVPPNQPPFAPPEAPVAPIDPADIPMPADGFAAAESALRGRYLSAMASVCVDCHTPELDPPGSFMFDFSKVFGGGRAFPAALFGYPVPPYPPVIYTTNLTPHATGLEGYDLDDIIRVMKDGLDKDGDGVCAPTHSGPSSPYAGLTDADVTDIANYILSLPPVDNAIAEDCKGPPPA
jgi:mono/diheme cytochrome c family protein